MVRLQTLDLRIGVRVLASQPNILKHFLRTSESCPTLRRGCIADCCGEVSPSTLSTNEILALRIRWP